MMLKKQESRRWRFFIGEQNSAFLLLRPDSKRQVSASFGSANSRQVVLRPGLLIALSAISLMSDSIVGFGSGAASTIRNGLPLPAISKGASVMAGLPFDVTSATSL